MPSELYLLGGGIVVALVVVILLFKAFWRVAEPNEALIISGLGARGHGDTLDSLGFKIITGKGAAVLPGFQTSRRLRLDTRSANLQVSCVTQQGIPVHIRGVVIYKVGDDFSSIANAARRFLDQQDFMTGAIHELFTGHLRSIIGNLTVEDLILNRERLTSETRASAADEMSKLGLVVDSLQIQEIDDETGYIVNLGKPHAARVAATARIAEAQRDQEATEAEQEAAARKAAAVRESKIQQAGYQAEMDQAAAKARQAGPLSEATARQQVVVQETKAAELEAQLAEQRLQSQVRKPADAKAYETVSPRRRPRPARPSCAPSRRRARSSRPPSRRPSPYGCAARRPARPPRRPARRRPRRPRPAGWPTRRPPRRSGSPRPRHPRPRAWPRRRRSGHGRRRSRTTRRRSSPSSSPSAGPRWSRRARRRSPASTTWWCSTARRAWRRCWPRRSRWAAPGWGWPGRC
jgi:flotillin